MAGSRGGEEPNGGTAGIEDLMSRVGIKDRHIRELHERLAGMRVEADEAIAAREAKEEKVEELTRERGRLKERIATLEEELRVWRRGREGSERRAERLERELERRETEISRRDFLLSRRDDEMETLAFETDALVARKEGALDDAMRRVAGLERDLEEREDRISSLEATVEELRGRLEEERGARERLADPANRLRSAIDLFNESKHRETVTSLSRTLGQPNVHVYLDEGEEPPAILAFTWRGVTWQRYAANPGLAVEEPRVYLAGAGEDLSGVEEQPPNARVGPGGKVLLGL
jgi:ribonucrease Y